MEFLNPACWKKIRHVESATDKKRHVEGMKKGMLKIEFLNPACWNCCRKKRHVEGMKNGMLKNGAADSGMLKLLQKKTACWRYKNGMLKNGAAESGMLKKNPACWNCNGKKTACWSKIRHVEVKSGMLKIRQKNGMCLHRSFCWWRARICRTWHIHSDGQGMKSRGRHQGFREGTHTHTR